MLYLGSKKDPMQKDPTTPEKSRIKGLLLMFDKSGRILWKHEIVVQLSAWIFYLQMMKTATTDVLLRSGPTTGPYVSTETVAMTAGHFC